MQRIEQVCAQKGLTKKGWSRAAGFSENYIAMQGQRAKREPAFVLPEDGAAALARAAGISAEWLRFGTESHGHEVTPAPQDLRGSTLLESAVLSAWRRTDFPTETVTAVQTLARAVRTSIPGGEAAAEAVAMRWLRAADRMRRDGQPVTWEGLALGAALIDLTDEAASLGIEAPASPVAIPGKKPGGSEG